MGDEKLEFITFKNVPSMGMEFVGPPCQASDRMQQPLRNRSIFGLFFLLVMSLARFCVFSYSYAVTPFSYYYS